ncbi:MAG TPA: serine hydrolase domain-containing protein [Caulobacteraceae bacterium]|nr:serine hydrolase domain-containing protein [Caulobacteraceae bacterium]
MPANADGAEVVGTGVAERLDTLFAPWNRTDEPGLTVGVLQDGAVIYRRGFGMASLESAVANTPATRMRIGSISKHFAALLALLLSEEGKLDLEAPIRTYIPELTGPAGDPTLRLLMQHRGGGRCAGDIGFLGHGMSRPPVGYGLRVQQRQTGRNFAPGTAMTYNNSGYSLLCLAIERAGGAAFGAQVKLRLCDPIGLQDTFLAPSDYDITPGIATMHIPRRDGRWRRGLLGTDEGTGDGAIVSTVDDMLRWTAHLRARDRFGSASSWAALTERPRYADGSEGVYALGLIWSAYRGRPILFHTGAVMGGTAMMLTFPEDDLDVVLLANGGRGADVVGLSLGVADIVLESRLGPHPPTVPAQEFRGVLGDWWSPQNGMIYSLVDQGGVLACSMAMAAGGVPVQRTEDGRLVYPAGSIGETSLRPAHGGLEVRFGGETLPYERLELAAGDAEAFETAALGRYASDDAGAGASIETSDEGLVLAVSDGYGEVRYRLTVLSPRVAFGRARGEMAIFRPTLTLDVADGVAAGFAINTARTRGLVFRRA